MAEVAVPSRGLLRVRQGGPSRRCLYNLVDASEWVASDSRIGSSGVSLIRQCLKEVTSLVLRVLVASGSSLYPVTWRCTIHCDPLTEQVIISGLQMSLTGPGLVSAVSSNLSALECPRKLSDTACAALGRFRRITALRLTSGWQGVRYGGVLRAERSRGERTTPRRRWARQPAYLSLAAVG